MSPRKIQQSTNGSQANNTISNTIERTQEAFGDHNIIVEELEAENLPAPKRKPIKDKNDDSLMPIDITMKFELTGPKSTKNQIKRAPYEQEQWFRTQ